MSEVFPPSGMGRPRLLLSSIGRGSGVRRLAVPYSRPTAPVSVVNGIAADRHARDSAPAQGLGQMGGQDPESPMPLNRNLPHTATVALPGPWDRTSGADGLQRLGVRPGSWAWAVRGRSTSPSSASRPVLSLTAGAPVLAAPGALA
jgi:hypothetical protein